MAFTVNPAAASFLNERGWVVSQHHEMGGTWKATYESSIIHNPDNNKITIMNNVVLRDGSFSEEFIITFKAVGKGVVVDTAITFSTFNALYKSFENMMQYICECAVRVEYFAG